MADFQGLIREYYACFNERRFQDAARLFARDAVLEHPSYRGKLEGGDAYVEIMNLWVRAFPDAHAEIEHVEQRGDTICEVELLGSGTHREDVDMGAYGFFRATGVHASLRYRELLEIRDGRITYASIMFDVHELIRQLTRQA